MRRGPARLLAVALAGAFLPACSSDDEKTSSSTTGDSTGSGGTGSGSTGSGGQGSGTGASGGGGAGGATGATSTANVASTGVSSTGSGGGASTGCDWNVDALPLPIPVHDGPFFHGGLAFEASCDLLVAGGSSGELYRLDRTTGAVTVAATGFPPDFEVVGVAYVESTDDVYVAGHVDQLGSSIHRIVDGAPVHVVDVDYLSEIAAAPEAFAGRSGLILAVGASGRVSLIDPAVPSVVPIHRGSGGADSWTADVAFALDGSVAYLAMTNLGSIVAMTPEGVVSTVASGLPVIDGLALDPAGAFLYATTWDADNLVGVVSTVSVPDGVVTFHGNAPIDVGYKTSGLVVDGSGDLLMKSFASNDAAIIAP